MKAALFPEKGKVEVITKELPELNDGEALIKVKYAGICGSDLHVFQGHHATATYPRVPGHELVGELVNFKGKMKKGIVKGDPVVAQPFFSCGTCQPCITGHDNVCEELKILGIHTDGTFAEYVKIPIKKIYKVRPDMDMKLAALAEPLAVAVHDVMVSGLKVSDQVLVSGGGPIGLLIAIVARQAGAVVTVSEVSDFRLDYAKQMGFNVVNPISTPLVKAAKSVNNGSGYDVVFETSGVASAMLESTAAVKIRGTVVIVGITNGNVTFSTNDVYSKELTIFGVRIHSQYAFEKAVNLLCDGTLDDDLYKIVDEKIYPLDEVADALKYCIEDMNHFKTLIEI